MSASPSQGYSVPAVFDPQGTFGVNLLPHIIHAEQLGGSVLANAKIFSPDVSPSTTINPSDGVYFVLTLCFDDRVEVQVTFDGGTNWCFLNEGEELRDEGALHTFVIPVKDGDLFNVRSRSATGVKIVRVAELKQ